MIVRKTVRNFRRFARSWSDRGPKRHCEQVLRETWWLFGLIPLYSRDSIEKTNL